MSGAYSHLSKSTFNARSMFMRWPTRVTPRSIRSSFCRLGRWLPSMSFSMKASRCSPRFKLSSQSATSCLFHIMTGLVAKGLLEGAWMSVSGEGERLRPVPRLSGGVGRPNTSVMVGEVADGGRDEEVQPRPESGGDMMGLGVWWWWWCGSTWCGWWWDGGRLSDGTERLGGVAVAIGGTLGPDWVEKVTVVFCCVPETRDIPSGFLHSGARERESGLNRPLLCSQTLCHKRSTFGRQCAFWLQKATKSNPL